MVPRDVPSGLAFIFQDDANRIQNVTRLVLPVRNDKLPDRGTPVLDKENILSQVQGVKTRAIKKPLDTGLQHFFFFTRDSGQDRRNTIRR